MKQAQYYLYENYGLPPHVVLSDAQLLQLGRAIAFVASADGVLAPEEQLPAGGAAA